MGELWGIYCENLGDNLARYNGMTLYFPAKCWSPFAHLAPMSVIGVGVQGCPALSPRSSLCAALAAACVQLVISGGKIKPYIKLASWILQARLFVILMTSGTDRCALVVSTVNSSEVVVAAFCIKSEIIGKTVLSSHLSMTLFFCLLLGAIRETEGLERHICVTREMRTCF